MSELSNKKDQLFSALSSREGALGEFKGEVERMLKVLQEKLKDSTVELPCGCRLYPSGEFVREMQVVEGEKMRTVRVIHVMIGKSIETHQLLEFKKLVEDEFVEKLTKKLNDEREGIMGAKVKISLL